jgi:putative serine/threonine protein kinase
VIDGLAAVLCYPKVEPAELEARVKELASLRVEAIEPAGPQSIGRVRILGKGCVGIVVKAQRHGKVVALKIRRTDANRPDMSHEAHMLRLANSIEVGPRLLAESKNFLVMEFIEDLPLARWVQLLPVRGSKRRARKLIATLLDDCFRLDQVRVDHGELSNAPRNVLVDGADIPMIVDFESASDRRRPSNVTSIAQYLLIGGGPAKRLRGIMKWQRRKSLIHALRDYKRTCTTASYEKIKTIAKL